MGTLFSRFLLSAMFSLHVYITVVFSSLFHSTLIAVSLMMGIFFNLRLIVSVRLYLNVLFDHVLQAELRKKEEREAQEAMRRNEELREAKRQQQRLNFLLSQTELYSHFMQNKPTSQASTTLEDSRDQLLASEDAETMDDDDPEAAELKREALRAAQKAVSKQKEITNAFDGECLRLRQNVEPEGLGSDASITGPGKMDLLHP